jgi:SAM-dependent methyltransferase
VTETVETPGDVFYRERDEGYLREAEAEASFWDKPQMFTIDYCLPVVDAYLNERFTGDPRVAWYETIPRYGTFTRGCALGAGAPTHRRKILEQNPELHLTVYDISEESLALLDRELGGRFPGRVSTERLDLNFDELPEDAYDLIMSYGCIHHLYNLEHIAYQINRSLTEGGYCFLVDYVAESRFQFAPEKKRVFEEAFADAQPRLPSLRGWHIEWPDTYDWTFSPFEAVRSDETLGVFGRYLDEIDRRVAAPLIGMLVFLRPPQPLGRTRTLRAAALRQLADLTAPLRGRSRDRQRVRATLARHLIPLDRQLSDAGTLLPWTGFAVYRKKGRASP